MLSEKTMVTSEIPNFEIDRIYFTFGRLAISISTGMVINCSISWVDRFPEVIIT